MNETLNAEAAATLKNGQDTNNSIWVSFAEIYNEHIYDLLQVVPNIKNLSNLRFKVS